MGGGGRAEGRAVWSRGSGGPTTDSSTQEQGPTKPPACTTHVRTRWRRAAASVPCVGRQHTSLATGSRMCCHAARYSASPMDPASVSHPTFTFCRTGRPSTAATTTSVAARLRHTPRGYPRAAALHAEMHTTAAGVRANAGARVGKGWGGGGEGMRAVVRPSPRPVPRPQCVDFHCTHQTRRGNKQKYGTLGISSIAARKSGW